MANVLEKIGICRECLCGECEYDELRREKGETVCMQKLLDDAAEAIERKKGKWEYRAEFFAYGIAHFDCSICGESVLERTHFCPNCGADMGGET